MGEDQLKQTQEQADFDGSFLVDYKEKGHKVQLMGKEPVEGTDAYKLQVTLKNGNTQTVYLDAEEYLEIKNETKRLVRGTETETETISGDYKEVDGVLMAFSSESGPKGSPSSAKQKFTIEKVEFNVPIPDSEFTMPGPVAPKAAEPKKEEPKKQTTSEEKKK
jgi:outer membrane lipoprotein-sorting protein